MKCEFLEFKRTGWATLFCSLFQFPLMTWVSYGRGEWASVVVSLCEKQLFLRICASYVIQVNSMNSTICAPPFFFFLRCLPRSLTLMNDWQYWRSTESIPFWWTSWNFQWYPILMYWFSAKKWAITLCCGWVFFATNLQNNRNNLWERKNVNKRGRNKFPVPHKIKETVNRFSHVVKHANSLNSNYQEYWSLIHFVIMTGAHVSRNFFG